MFYENDFVIKDHWKTSAYLVSAFRFSKWHRNPTFDVIVSNRL
jgi:hypothetical protein